MGRKRHTPEQIIRKLREAEVELAKGQPMVEVARKLGITEQTYYLYGLLPLVKRNLGKF
jgi:DNA-binding CsgD family transcriptional regulator